ncbi:unnamed protein product [Calicophoron daubneyi]|uniref:Uncharacterized protein n=1 Tax=Calicophoron daubneyi TaxID=300641 RepID=A0AAV2TQN9_CALDB
MTGHHSGQNSRPGVCVPKMRKNHRSRFSLAEAKVLRAMVFGARDLLRRRRWSFDKDVWAVIAKHMHFLGWPKRSWFAIKLKGTEILRELMDHDQPSALTKCSAAGKVNPSTRPGTGDHLGTVSSVCLDKSIQPSLSPLTRPSLPLFSEQNSVLSSDFPDSVIRPKPSVRSQTPSQYQSTESSVSVPSTGHTYLPLSGPPPSAYVNCTTQSSTISEDCGKQQAEDKSQTFVRCRALGKTFRRCQTSYGGSNPLPDLVSELSQEDSTMQRKISKLRYEVLQLKRAYWIRKLKETFQ